MNETGGIAPHNNCPIGSSFSASGLEHRFRTYSHLLGVASLRLLGHFVPLGLAGDTKAAIHGDGTFRTTMKTAGLHWSSSGDNCQLPQMSSQLADRITQEEAARTVFSVHPHV